MSNKALLVLTVLLGMHANQAASAREYKHQRIELGPGRTQRSLRFYTELPQSRRDAERLTRHTLPCGTPLTPVAYQVAKDGDETLAFISFLAPHTAGHILLEEGHREQANLLDYFLFDPESTPFCLSGVDQTLSQCGAIGVTLTYTPEAVLQAEIKNLSTNQVLFLDWKNTRLIWEGGSVPVLPSDLFLRQLEQELQGPLGSLQLLGMRFQTGLSGFAPNTIAEDLEALWELSRRVDVDVSELILEPLGPGQKRQAVLSVMEAGGWKSTAQFLPSTRGVRRTLSIPIGRVSLAASSAPAVAEAGRAMLVPRGNLTNGTIGISAPKPPTTEECTISFTIR